MSVKIKVENFIKKAKDNGYISDTIDYHGCSVVGNDNLDMLNMLKSSASLFTCDNKAATIPEVCAILVCYVMYGLGGKDSSDISIKVDGHEKVFKARAKIWDRDKDASIAPGKLTKRRAVRVGAYLWSIIKNRPPGFYLNGGYTTSNFCMGYEFVETNANLALKYLVILYVATTEMLAGRTDLSKDTNAVSFLRRAYKVSRKVVSGQLPTFKAIVETAEIELAKRTRQSKI